MGTGDALLAQDSQGWSYTLEDVCSTCVDEPALSAIIASEAQPGVECSFCGADSATSLDVLMTAFFRGLRRKYEPALDVLYYADDFTPRYDTSELVYDYGSIFAGDGLLDAVLNSIKHDEWVARDFAVPHHGDAMLVAWDEFCRKVKFETRYVVWLKPPEAWEGQGGEVAVGQVLSKVAELVEEYELIKTRPALTPWWRAQTHGPDPIEHTPGRLGTVPADLAKAPNRMSPAGIPMFYGAADADTAIKEVIGTPGASVTDTHATWAAFQTSQACTVVDFTSLPPPVSIFDPKHGDQFFNLRFLHSFVNQLSSKTDPDWAAVDYVPTQVLTEFFLRVYTYAAQPLEGLIYRSAITGEPSIVMSVANDQCVAQNPGWQGDGTGPLLLGLAASTVESAATGLT